MDYPYGYCGMPCALCTRNRTEGKSRCPGCSCGGYYTDVCKVHRCCREKGLPHCGACPDFPCARLGKMGDFRDLNTGHVKQRTCALIAACGFDAWYGGYAQKAELLGTALQNYNDGRMKRFLCELFIRRDPDEIRELMRRAKAIGGAPKEAGRAFRDLSAAMDAEGEPSAALRPFAPGDLPLFARWLSAPHVARWYHQPEDWLREAADLDGAYGWIHRFVAEREGRPVGFCQYYEYRRGGESWHGSADVEGAYSLDYLIGEPRFLGRGLGRQMTAALLEKIRPLEGARRVIARPEPDNRASCGVLRACGFRFDRENQIYVYDFCAAAAPRGKDADAAV